jgi:hypothetical protein
MQWCKANLEFDATSTVQRYMRCYRKRGLLNRALSQTAQTPNLSIEAHSAARPNSPIHDLAKAPEPGALDRAKAAIKESPEENTATICKQTGLGETTIRKARRELIAANELDERTEAKAGRIRPRRKSSAGESKPSTKSENQSGPRKRRQKRRMPRDH